MDNILLHGQNLVKLCDFGISKKMIRGKNIFEHIGTPAYLAPEIIEENGYKGFSADIWSLGVMSFIALTSEVPFQGESIEELNSEIMKK